MPSAEPDQPGYLRRHLLAQATRVRRPINWAFRRWAGGTDRPVFFDPDDVEPALRQLEQNFDVIREELMELLPQRHKIPRYHDADPGQTHISAGEQDWRVFLLYAEGLPVPGDNLKLCPRTAELVSRIPRVRRAFFSILDPGKNIPAHCGPYHALLRYHLGLKVPETNPPKIRVKDQYHTWGERVSMVFDDSWEHQIYNEATEARAILIVDVLRPVPLHLRALDWFWRKYRRVAEGPPSLEAAGVQA